MNLLRDKEEFDRWWGHPGTQAFRMYLVDRVEALSEAWARGAEMSPEQQAQAVLMNQLVELSADSIAADYGVDSDNNSN